MTSGSYHRLTHQVLRRHFPPDNEEEQPLGMIQACSSSENDLSPSLVIWMLIIIGTECILGILANGFIAAINTAEWIHNKVFSTSGKILLCLGVSRIGLQSLMMLELTLSSTSPQFYNDDVMYHAFRGCFMFLNHCSLWFAAWLSFFYFVKVADFSYPLFLKLKWRISGLMPWLLQLSVFASLGQSVLFFQNIHTMNCNSIFAPRSFNSTRKKSFAEATVINLVLFLNLGLFIPLVMFILAATLLIISLKRHILHMKSNATGSRDPSMEAHLGAIRAISYFLILYIVKVLALFLYMSNFFDINSPFNILCKIIMAAYPAGHSILMIQDNPGLKRAWKRLQAQVHLYFKK